MSSINERIYKTIKANKSLTQSGLASYLGKSNSTLSQWLSEGRPIPADCIIPICEYLGISIMWLLTGNEHKNDLLTDKQNYDKEQALLKNFNALPDSIKNQVIGYIEGCLDSLKNTPG